MLLVNSEKSIYQDFQKELAMKKLILIALSVLTPTCGTTEVENNAEKYYKLGIARHRKGEYDRSIEEYSRAIETNPRYLKAYINRGVAYARKGQLDQAISDYTMAMELNPKCALAYHNRGVAYTRKGLLDKAISDYSKAIDINSKIAVAYYNRGTAYYFKGENDKAWKDVNMAQSLGYPVRSGFLESLHEASEEDREELGGPTSMSD
jgi:tetratricopeptide (TPR) repeat protein